MPLVFLVLVFLGLLPAAAQQLLIGATLGVFAIALAAVRPGPALATLIILVPVQVHLFSVLYRLGLPASFVRGLSQVKEAIIVGLVVAAARRWALHRHRLDNLDRVSFAFVALVGTYVLVPVLLGPLFNEVFPVGPTGIGVLITAARRNLALVIILLAVRSLELPDEWRERVLTTIIGVATVVAVGGVVEFFFNDLWQQFEEMIGFAQYHTDVLGIEAPPASVTSVVLGREFLRAGSTLNQLTLGFFLLTGVGIQLGRVAESFHPLAVTRLGLMVTAAVVTITRSAVLALVVCVFVVTWSMRSKGLRRPRLVVAMFIGLGVLVFGANATGFTDRTMAAIRGDDPSATEHAERSSEAVRLIASEPLGQGLGAPGVATARGDQIPAENAYLTVATELGILGGLLFLWIVWRLLVALWQRRQDPAAAGMAGAIAGLLVGGFFLHAWTDLAVSWTIMAAAGVCLPRQLARSDSDDQRPALPHSEPSTGSVTTAGRSAAVSVTSGSGPR